MQAIRQHLQTIRRPFHAPPIPERDDVVLAVGALVLVVGLLLLAVVPLANRIGAGARVAAIKGNAATVQLAAESFARQHLGRFPSSVAQLSRYLPEKRVPANPLDGKPLAFARRPGDVTYTPGNEGRSYRIQGWIYGNDGGCRELVRLEGGPDRAGTGKAIESMETMTGGTP